MAALTLEEREARQTEIRARLNEIDAEHAGDAFPEDVRSEWNALNEEHDENTRVLDELYARKSRNEDLNADPDKREAGATFTTPRPGATRGADIYDLTTIRTSVGSPEEATSELRDRAKRAIELAVIPDDSAEKRDAKGHLERLLAKKDGDDGRLSRYLIATDAPAYKRAFPKLMSPAGMATLSREEAAAVAQVGAAQRALSLTTSAGGFAVPFVLDPTLVLTSDAAVNPFRAISRIEQITVDEWRGVTSAGVTASFDAEGSEVSDDSPTLAQPTVSTEMARAFVPYSIEIGMDWASIQNDLAEAIRDAKDTLEAAAFATGSGTDEPEGALVGATTTVTPATGGAFVEADLYTLETDLGPRFRPRATMVMNRSIAQEIRQFESTGGQRVWIDNVRVGLNNEVPAPGNYGARVLGYGAYESSEMDATVTTGSQIIIFGDFRFFLIADRIGLTMESIPHLFATGNNRPSGQRGLFAYWRVGSGVLSPNAFRVLDL